MLATSAPPHPSPLARGSPLASLHAPLRMAHAEGRKSKAAPEASAKLATGLHEAGECYSSIARMFGVS